MYVEGLKWIVNNGESINFWKDFWLPCGPIRKLIEGPLTRADEQLSVQQCVDPNLEGMTCHISFELPKNVTSLIKPYRFQLIQTL